METLRVHGDAPAGEPLARAVAALRSGALIIYPTDTLYALGGRALDAAAVAHVRVAKGRQPLKPLPLVVADLEQARTVTGAWPQAAERLARRFWPGPLTLVLPASPAVPDEVSVGSGTIAVRVPGLMLTRALCGAAGALVSTSANRAGEPPPATCAEAVDAVGASAALALDAGPGRPLGSTIVDLSGAAPRLVRAGPIAWEDVRAVLLSDPPC